MNAGAFVAIEIPLSYRERKGGAGKGWSTLIGQGQINVPPRVQG